MSRWAWLLPTLPAAAALLTLLLGRRLAALPALPALRLHPATLPIVATLATLAFACALLPGALAHPGTPSVHAAAYTPTGTVAINVGTYVDGLSAIVAVMVCIVSLLVQVYSVGYLHGDRRYPSYAAWLALFTAAMLLVVVGSNLLEMYVGWEVMGICSYLLVGHYWESRGAGLAAIKAFVTTRLGDVGFLFGIFVLGLAAHSFDLADVLRPGAVGHPALAAGTLLLLGGVAGKSAQLPLQTWLPDAMAGPTPVSALIHAATMVAAGGYVVARLYPDFAAAPVTMDVLGVVAAVTMLLAALSALAQDDLKRTLAWSTVSQLGYMTAGLAVGGYSPAVFHLLNHAGFKALLFLGAGSVLHAVGTNRMSEMGGLWRRMPLTFVTFVVGALALAGLPPLSGAFSKDSILVAAWDARGGASATGVVPAVALAVYGTGLLTVLLTAVYTTRMVVRTFLGAHRGSSELHEAPPVMAVPLVLLAVPAAFGGLLALHGALPTWLPSPVAGAAGIGIGGATLALSGGLAALGILAVLAVFRRFPTSDPALLLSPLVRRTFEHGFFFDDLYRVGVVRPVMALGRLVRDADTLLVDGAVNGAGRSTRVAAGVVRLAQNGNVQAYATVMLVGVVAVTVAVAAS